MEDFQKTILEGRLVLSIGTKHSGKSYFMLQYLRFAMKNNLYQKYILILPSFEFEENDSYDFIETKQKHIFVFTEYNPLILEHHMISQKKNKKKTLIILDDASGECIFTIDDEMKKFITSIRHFKSSMWIIAHSAKRILNPFIRQQVDVLFLYKLSDKDLLEALFREFLSMHPLFFKRGDFQNFCKLYVDFQDLFEFPCLYINVRNKTMCPKVCNWQLN